MWPPWQKKFLNIISQQRTIINVTEYRWLVSYAANRSSATKRNDVSLLDYQFAQHYYKIYLISITLFDNFLADPINITVHPQLFCIVCSSFLHICTVLSMADSTRGNTLQTVTATGAQCRLAFRLTLATNYLEQIIWCRWLIGGYRLQVIIF